MYRHWPKVTTIIIAYTRMCRLVRIFISIAILDRIRWATIWRCRPSVLSPMVRICSANSLLRCVASIDMIPSLLHCRHVYSNTSGKRAWIWLVPSEVVIMRWPVLDGRFNGDDDIECFGSGVALRLEYYTLSTGTDDDHRLLGHDVELYILGTIFGPVWTKTGELLTLTDPIEHSKYSYFLPNFIPLRTGAYTVRRFVICLRFLQFIGTKFRLVAVVTWPGWFCHWMRATIVSLWTDESFRK